MPLSDGSITPNDILKIKGPSAVQQYLVNEVQEVYRLQGVKISDKHFEVIIRQMMQKVQVQDAGDTTFLENQLVHKKEFIVENDNLYGKKVIESAAIKNPNIIKEASEYFGNQCIVVAVDAKKHNDDWFVYSHGGTKKTDLLALSWIEKAQKLGAGEILLTSMDKDGTKSGFDNELLSKVSKFLKIPVIASGGVGTLDHFYDGVIKGKADALLAASVFHFNEISIKEVKEYLKDKNISIRD